MKNKALLFSLLVLRFGMYAQAPVCGLGWLEESQEQNSVPVGQIKASFHNKIDSARNSGIGELAFRSEIVVPVVVHIVWNSPTENLTDAQVLEQIEILNRDFNSENKDLRDVPEEFKPFIARKGIRFCLAAETPDGQPTSGITRNWTDIEPVGTKQDLYGIAPAWDSERYLNIWAANTGDFLAGLGTYPGLVPPEKQGMVVHPKYFGFNNSIRYNLGRVAVHEVGHYFGLDHIWGSDEACETDDNVEDTPLQQHSYKGCPAHPQATCGSNDMFMNFMDYVDDGCMVMFTQGQVERMLATMELFRPGLAVPNVQCVNVGKEMTKPQFLAYPNPTGSNNELTIRFDEPISESGDIEIFNPIGQRVYELKTVIFDGMSVELPELSSGIYWIRIGDKSYKIMVK